MTCHNTAAVQNTKQDQTFWGIYGAKAAIQDGYKYSDWLKGGIEWNDEALASLGSQEERKSRLLWERC